MNAEMKLESKLQRANELQTLSGISLGDIAQAIGKSKATISKVLSGEYESKNNELMLNAIINYLSDDKAESVENTKSVENKNTFLSQGQKTALMLFDIAKTSHTFEMICGNSGAGKTSAVKLFLDELVNKPLHNGIYKSCLYVKMDKSLSVGGIVDICSIAIRGNTRSGSLLHRKTNLHKDLKASQVKMLIVDEADLFCNDTKEQFIKKIEVFRSIYEAGISVVIVGLNRYEERIREIGEEYISRRIKIHFTIACAKSDLSSYYDFLDLPQTDEKEAIITKAWKNGNYGVIYNLFDLYTRIGDLKMANALIFSTGGVS